MLIKNSCHNADYKLSDLIGRTTFQSLEQLVVPDPLSAFTRMGVWGTRLIIALQYNILDTIKCIHVFILFFVCFVLFFQSTLEVSKDSCQ